MSGNNLTDSPVLNVCAWRQPECSDHEIMDVHRTRCFYTKLYFYNEN